jgi:hypothetical protein
VTWCLDLVCHRVWVWGGGCHPKSLWLGGFQGSGRILDGRMCRFGDFFVCFRSAGEAGKGVWGIVEQHGERRTWERGLGESLLLGLGW